MYSVTMPLTIDQDRFDSLYGNVQKSLDHWSGVTKDSLDKGIAINKDLSAFYERLLLLNSGTIGVSVSALIALGTKAGLGGHKKYFLIVCVSLAWAFLLRSIILCKSVMMICISSNKRLFKEWMKDTAGFYASMMEADMRRLTTAFSGTVDVDGELVDPATKLNDLARQMREKFEEVKDEIAKQLDASPASTESGTKGAAAIAYMQMALVLLGIAAISLLLSIS